MSCTGKSAQPGVIEIDIHGMNRYQAKICIESALKRAGTGIYRIRVIHGYNRGTELRDMVRGEISKNKKVLRIEVGMNMGQTDLVLREWF